jgi:biopolymer transport protein ExbD
MQIKSFVNKPRQGAGDAVRPQLTSLIDVMTILLVFLIQSFSAEGSLVSATPAVALPLSSATAAPQPHPTVTMTTDALLLDGKKVVALRELHKSEALSIAALEKALGARNKGDTAAAASVVVEADRRISFADVKKVLYTCSKAGFSDFSVLVLREEPL